MNRIGRWPKLWRWTVRVCLALFLVLLAAVAVLEWQLRSSLPILEGEVTLSGLTAAAEITRDGAGVPVIRAETRVDAARLLGWLHGQDRFFQMDLSRRAGAGELAAFFGPLALDHDRHVRFFPGRAWAEAAFERLEAADRALLEAYAAGVNAGLTALRAPPPEYLRPGMPLVPWRPEDGFLVALSMWFDLQDSHGYLDETRGLLRDRLPSEVVTALFLHGSAWDAPLDASRRIAGGLPVESWLQAIREAEAGRSAEARTAPPEESPGSNAWAARGSATEDGRAIVANDMHLALRVPHVYYRAGLRIGHADTKIEIDGATLPGMPVFIVGSNRFVAWGFTNSYIDTTDLIQLETDPAHPGRYRGPGGWASWTERVETIQVFGRTEPEILRVRESQWGPVREGEAGRLYAVKWLASLPEAWNLGLRRMETARSVDEALEVAHRAGLPTQNCVIADATGDIAWTLMGPIPGRRGALDGFYPLTGKEWGEGWSGTLPVERYPVIHNPPGERIWTANQQILMGRDFRWLGDGGYDAGYRASRIRDLLSAGAYDEKGMFSIQSDVGAPVLERWRALVVRRVQEAASPGPGTAEVAELLREWEGEAAVASRAYPILRDIRIGLIQRVHERLFLPMGKVRLPVPLNAGVAVDEIAYQLYAEEIDALAPAEEGSWRAVLLTEVRRAAERRPFAETWGDRNTLRMQHPFSVGLPWLARWLDMPVQPLPGDTYSIRVQRPRFGASQRMVVSPGREEAGIYQQPGGSSGHPRSPFYRSGHDDWAEAVESPFLPGAPRYRLRLVPPSTD